MGETASKCLERREKSETQAMVQEETSRSNMSLRPSGASQTHEDRPHFMLNTVEAWRTENIYITKSVREVKEKISSKGCVCVIGVPGAGKSTAILHAALSLETDGFIIYCVYGPDEFLKYYDINKKQVFVLDDALGVYSVDQGKVKSWQEHNENVKFTLGTNTKLLVSIRTQIFMNEMIRDKDIVFLDKSVTTDHVDFSDADYKLGIDDMRGMLLTHYMTTHGSNVDNINKVIKQLWPYTEKELTEMTEGRRQYEMSRCTAGIEFSNCFPLLCKVFVNTDFVKQNPEGFFTNPFPALKKVFQNIKTDNKHQFCALVLCTMFDGKLTDDLVSSLSESPLCDNENKLDKDKLELRNYIMSTFKLKYPRDVDDLKSALNSLTGVYILYIGGIYKISHAVFHDIVTYLYNDPLFVFKYGTREFICDRVRLNKDKQQHDPYVLVYSDDTNIERLADRLFTDFMSDRVTGSRYIAENPNIHDERLFDSLIRKISQRKETRIYKTLINNLFEQCMEIVEINMCNYEHGDVPQYKLIEFCVQTGVDCNRTFESEYPLQISVTTESLQLTQLLLHGGADKRRITCSDSILHYVCRFTKYNRLELMKLLTQHGEDQSVVRFQTRDRHMMLNILPNSDNLQLEEVLSDNSIKVLATDEYRIKHYVESYTGNLQLVELVHDNILTYVDWNGRNILHWSVDDYAVTDYLLTYQCLQQEINKRDKDGRTPYWFVVNDKKPSFCCVTKDVVIEDKDDIIELYNKYDAKL